MTAELRLLLANAGIDPPYLLVGHSLAGMICRLFAVDHPEDVAGIVFLDAVHEDQRELMPRDSLFTRLKCQARWQLLRTKPILARSGILRMRNLPCGCLRGMTDEVREEAAALGLASNAYDWTFTEASAINATEKQVRRTGPLPDVPVVVVTAGKDYPSDDVKRAWMICQDRLLALAPGSEQIVATMSGHSIHTDQPDLVTRVIRQMVESIRNNT